MKYKSLAQRDAVINIVDADTTLDQFIATDFLRFTMLDDNSVAFAIDGGISNDHIYYDGDFKMTKGVISGEVTSISHSFYDPFDGEIFSYDLKFSKSFHVDDLVALQDAGTDALGRLLLSGDDDITGRIFASYEGDDIFHLGVKPGRDLEALDGGDGFDSVIYDTPWSTAINLDLVKQAKYFTSIERYIGSKHADEMRGGDENDLFYGGKGADLLVGRWGNDKLFGGLGNDRFIGGPGRDTLTGNGGRDTFIFEKVSESTRGAHDLITDFDRAYDLIDLHKVDANSKRGGNQEFDFIGNHAFTGHAGELRYYETRGLTHVVADIDGNKTIDFDVALKGSYKLTAADFDL